MYSIAFGDVCNRNITSVSKKKKLLLKKKREKKGGYQNILLQVIHIHYEANYERNQTLKWRCLPAPILTLTKSERAPI